MRMPISTLLQELAAAHQAGGTLILMFDYDGTLVPLADHPAAAALAPSTRQLLKRLAATPRVRIGVLSGREIDDLARRVALRRVYLAGTGGLELRLNGARIIHPCSREAAVLIEQVVKRLHQTTVLFPRSWVESKCLGCTVHYRAVDPDSIGAIPARVIDALRPWAERLNIVQGPLALEITPDLGWDKGTAVRMMLECIRAETPRVVFAGDGDNDAPAYRVVAELQGTTLGVGGAAPAAAQYRLPDPAALLACLNVLCEMLAPKRRPRRQATSLGVADRPLKRYGHA
jgi:trehalose 6-phosphate phosphatase